MKKWKKIKLLFGGWKNLNVLLVLELVKILRKYPLRELGF